LPPPRARRPQPRPDADPEVSGRRGSPDRRPPWAGQPVSATQPRAGQRIPRRPTSMKAPPHVLVVAPLATNRPARIRRRGLVDGGLAEGPDVAGHAVRGATERHRCRANKTQYTKLLFFSLIRDPGG